MFEARGPILGASWATLGRSWGPLGPSWSVGKPKPRNPQETLKNNWKFLTLRVSPPAHPETTPRRVEVIKEVREQRGGQSNRAKEEGGDGGERGTRKKKNKRIVKVPQNSLRLTRNSGHFRK